MQLLSVCPADLLPGVLGLGSEGEGEASSSGSSGSGSIDAAARLDRRLALLDHFQRQAWMAKNTLSPTLRRIDESASAASKSNSSSNSSSSSCSTLEVGGLTAAASARLDSPANLARLYPVLITLTHLVQSDLSSRRFYKALFLGTTSSAVGASGAAEAASPVSSQPVRIDRSAYSGLVDLVVAQMLQQLQDGGLKRYASELIFALCDENGKSPVLMRMLSPIVLCFIFFITVFLGFLIHSRRVCAAVGPRHGDLVPKYQGPLSNRVKLNN